MPTASSNPVTSNTSNRVHAVLVVRPDGRTPAAFHLRRTIAALGEQVRPVDALTIVVCGGDDHLFEVAGTAAAAKIVTAPASTSFAAATALASSEQEGGALWLLAQDTAPEPDALARLAGELERSPSAAFVPRASSSLVMPPSAETTTTTWLASLAWTISATLRILSALATEEPPNFKTYIE